MAIRTLRRLPATAAGSPVPAWRWTCAFAAGAAASLTALVLLMLPRAWPVASRIELVAVLAIGALAAMAALVRRQAQRQRVLDDEREQRWSSLLAIAADWHWELDRTFRFS